MFRSLTIGERPVSHYADLQRKVEDDTRRKEEAARTAHAEARRVLNAIKNGPLWQRMMTATIQAAARQGERVREVEAARRLQNLAHYAPAAFLQMVEAAEQGK